MGVLGPAVVGAAPGELLGRKSAGEPHGLAAIVVLDVVPPVDELDAAGEVFTDRERCAHSEVVIRNGPGEKKRAGIIPIAVGFADFSTRAGDDWSEVHLETLS